MNSQIVGLSMAGWFYHQIVAEMILDVSTVLGFGLDGSMKQMRVYLDIQQNPRMDTSKGKQYWPYNQLLWAFCRSEGRFENSNMSEKIL